MEIDMYKNRIAHLEELHRILDKDITTFEKENPYHNETAIKEKKKQKQCQMLNT